MFCRISTFRTPGPEQIKAGFEKVRSDLEEMEGFSHAYLLVDPGGTKGISITMWETQEALDATRAQADQLRERGAQAAESSIESVEEFEVKLTAGTPTTA